MLLTQVCGMTLQGCRYSGGEEVSRFSVPAWAIPSFPLHSSVSARGLTDAVLGSGMSILLAELCQHPNYPKWNSFLAFLCSTAYSQQQGLTWTP